MRTSSPKRPATAGPAATTAGRPRRTTPGTPERHERAARSARPDRVPAPAAERERRRGRDDGPERPARAAAAYDDAYLDGLFTYCLTVMGEHDAATAALGEALALAERQHERGRRPADPALWRPWLYALARWACGRRREAAPGRAAGPATPRACGEDARRRRRELAALSWPEAEGTAPEQREALELAVRHQLTAAEVGRVLRLRLESARSLLATAACEVERTRGALAAVAAGGCPAVAVLSGTDPRLLLGPRLRGELVRHVDECTSCRLVAQHAMASAGWPGVSAGASPGARPGAPPGAVGHAAAPRRGATRSARLPVLAAPRPAVHAARLAVRRARAQHAPRFDREGFPLPERDRAARRERLRSRALTGTVVVTVLAAPAMALWAAYRGAVPETGEARGGQAAVAAEDETAVGYGGDGLPYGPAGRDSGQAGARGGAADGNGPGDAGRAGEGQPAGGAAGGAVDTAAGGQPGGGQAPQPDADAQQWGTLTAEAVGTDTGARITLTAPGGAAVSWTAATDVDWLVLDQASGTLGPGQTTVVEVTVDRAREPAGPWRGRVTVDPAATVITLEGGGSGQQDPATPPPADPADPGTPPQAGGEPGGEGGGEGGNGEAGEPPPD